MEGRASVRGGTCVCVGGRVWRGCVRVWRRSCGEEGERETEEEWCKAGELRPTYEASREPLMRLNAGELWCKAGLPQTRVR